jgi:hypothetical protein
LFLLFDLFSKVITMKWEPLNMSLLVHFSHSTPQ